MVGFPRSHLRRKSGVPRVTGGVDNMTWVASARVVSPVPSLPCLPPLLVPASTAIAATGARIPTGVVPR